MKNSVSVIMLSILMSITAGAQKYCMKNLVGHWEGVDGAGLEVVDSSKIFLLYEGDKKQVLSYETNFSKSPCWFDFTISDSAGNISIKSLLLFLNEDLLQWQIFEDARPDHFSADKGSMFYLRRKK